MAIIKSKRFKDMQKENDELKTYVKKLDDKRETVSNLDEVIKKIRVELAELQNQKLTYNNSIQKLKASEQSTQLEVEKLGRELNHLRELKNDEQNNVLILSDQVNGLKAFNGEDNGKSTIKIDLPVLERDIKDAERKKSELQRETIDLENKLKDLYQRIVELTDQEQNVVINLEKKSKQLDAIESYRLIDAKAELNEVELKINETKELEKKSTADFQKRMEKLTEQERDLQNKVTQRLRELEESEEKLINKTSEARKDSENKMLALVVEEQKMMDSIESKRNKIDELKMTISSLEEEKNEISSSVEAVRKETSEISLQQNTQAAIRELQDEANKLKDHINQLKMTEDLKRELISKLKDELSSKEIEFASLEHDFTTRSNQLKEVSIKNQELAEEIEFKNKKLSKLTDTLENKKSQLGEYDERIKELGERVNYLNKEITQREIQKTETENYLLKEKEATKKLEEKQQNLKASIHSLKNRERGIQENNKVFEHRFAQLFEKYSKDINEMNNKRSVLEQMLQKKEKDINQQDETIIEKLAILDETEKVLLIRQKEVDTFDELLKMINDQKDLLKNDLKNLDDKSTEKRIQNQELKIESEILQKKIAEFENSLREILDNADGRLKESKEKRGTLDDEIREYETRLKELNINIKDSMNELVDLQTAIGNIKVEHEEHRLEINKLVSFKNKLLDEINKNKVIVDKYRKIKDRIRHEQETIKKRREERIIKDLNPQLLHASNNQGNDLTKLFKL
jgi:chromosome segregation ATPase